MSMSVKNSHPLLPLLTTPASLPFSAKASRRRSTFSPCISSAEMRSIASPIRSFSSSALLSSTSACSKHARLSHRRREVQPRCSRGRKPCGAGERRGRCRPALRARSSPTRYTTTGPSPGGARSSRDTSTSSGPAGRDTRREVCPLRGHRSSWRVFEPVGCAARSRCRGYQR